jgi:hypothetical protein
VEIDVAGEMPRVNLDRLHDRLNEL